MKWRCLLGHKWSGKIFFSLYKLECLDIGYEDQVCLRCGAGRSPPESYAEDAMYGEYAPMIRSVMAQQPSRPA